MSIEILKQEIENSSTQALELMLLVLKKEEYKKLVQEELDKRKKKEIKLTLNNKENK